MASLQEIKKQITNANSIGRACLAEKGVMLEANATTTEIMLGIADIETGTGEEVLDPEGVEF